MVLNILLLLLLLLASSTAYASLRWITAVPTQVCTTFHRRAHVVRRLMEQGLKPSETTTFFAPSRIEHYRVVPLKLALNQLELKLSQVRVTANVAGS